MPEPKKKKMFEPVFSDETLLEEFSAVELEVFVRGDAVVDEDVHAAVLADDVAQSVPNLVAECWNAPCPKKQNKFLTGFVVATEQKV